MALPCRRASGFVLSTSLRALVTLGLLSSGGAGAARAGDPPGRVEVTVLQAIALAPTMGIDGSSLSVAPRSAHIAWIARREGKPRWTIDGKEGPPYDVVGPLVWSEDGVHWAHAARTKSEWAIVVDGEERKAEGLIVRERSVRFVPGGTRIVYVAQRKAGEGKDLESLVVDGVVGPGFARIDAETVMVSRDGKRSAFRVRLGTEDAVVVDGVAGKPYPHGKVSPPQLTGDGQHVVHAVLTAPGFVVLDGVEGKAYEGVTPPVVAPAGPRFAYGVKVGAKARVVTGTAEGPEYIDVQAPGPRWSPDGTHVAYVALKGPKDVRVVLDGKESPAYGRSGIEDLEWSPDSKRVAWWGGRGAKPFYVIDGVEQPEYDLVGGGGAAAFSPDAKRFAYTGKRAGKWCVVADGKETAFVDGVAKGYPLFSADSKRLVYGTLEGSTWRLVAGDAPTPPLEGLTSALVAFGADGSTVGYAGEMGGVWRLVVEGVVAEGEVNAVLSEGLSADGPASFHGWFARGNEIVHLRAALVR